MMASYSASTHDKVKRLNHELFLVKQKQNVNGKGAIDVFPYSCDRLQCGCCDDSFHHLTSFLWHKSQHGLSDAVFRCELCNKMLDTQDSLKRHYIDHHKVAMLFNHLENSTVKEDHSKPMLISRARVSVNRAAVQSTANDFHNGGDSINRAALQNTAIDSYGGGGRVSIHRTAIQNTAIGGYNGGYSINRAAIENKVTDGYSGVNSINRAPIENTTLGSCSSVEDLINRAAIQKTTEDSYGGTGAPVNRAAEQNTVQDSYNGASHLVSRGATHNGNSVNSGYRDPEQSDVCSNSTPSQELPDHRNSAAPYSYIGLFDNWQCNILQTSDVALQDRNTYVSIQVSPRYDAPHTIHNLNQNNVCLITHKHDNLNIQSSEFTHEHITTDQLETFGDRTNNSVSNIVSVSFQAPSAQSSGSSESVVSNFEKIIVKPEPNAVTSLGCDGYQQTTSYVEVAVEKSIPASEIKRDTQKSENCILVSEETDNEKNTECTNKESGNDEMATTETGTSVYYEESRKSRLLFLLITETRLNQATPAIVQWFCCLICENYKTRYKNRFIEHVDKTHPVLPNKDHIVDPHPVESLFDGENVSIEKRILTLAEYENYLPLVGKHIKRPLEKQDIPGEFACPVCSKVFSRLRYLRRHKKFHKSDGQIFKCEPCAKVFRSSALLNRHILTVHEKIKKFYQCQQCDFRSCIKTDIHNHRQIHGDQTAVKCNVCRQTYSDRSVLKKHMQVHDPSRPFVCTFDGCRWRFKTEVMLNAHVRAHTTVGRFKCTHCGKAFGHKHHLHRHEKQFHGMSDNRNREYYNNSHSHTINNGSTHEPLTEKFVSTYVSSSVFYDTQSQLHEFVNLDNVEVVLIP